MEAKPENLGQELRAWAAHQLRIEPGAAPEAVRLAFLRQVEHDNGAPNLHAREAFLILTGRGNTARPSLGLEAVEEHLERELSEFATKYFKLPIAERKATWEQLHARGHGFARIAARLNSLRPHLWTVIPRLKRGSKTEQLTALLCELYTLPAAQRAARRQAWMDEARVGHEWGAWASAAVALREHHAALAALEPELIGRLADAEVRLSQKNQLRQNMRRVRHTAGSAGSGTSKAWRYWLILFIVVTLLRVLCTGLAPPANKSNVPQQTPVWKVHPDPPK